MSGSRSLCRLKANLRHDLCNIVEHSPVYGTFIQIPPFLLIVSMLLSKKQNKRLEMETNDEKRRIKGNHRWNDDRGNHFGIFAACQVARNRAACSSVMLSTTAFSIALLEVVSSGISSQPIR